MLEFVQCKHMTDIMKENILFLFLKYCFVYSVVDFETVYLQF